jgi:hypothetical protein
MVRCTSKRVKYAITIDLQLILVGALKLQTGKVPPYYMEDIKCNHHLGCDLQQILVCGLNQQKNCQCQLVASSTECHHRLCLKATVGTSQSRCPVDLLLISQDLILRTFNAGP